MQKIQEIKGLAESTLKKSKNIETHISEQNALLKKINTLPMQKPRFIRMPKKMEQQLVIEKTTDVAVNPQLPIQQKQEHASYSFAPQSTQNACLKKQIDEIEKVLEHLKLQKAKIAQKKVQQLQLEQQIASSPSITSSITNLTFPASNPGLPQNDTDK